MLKAVGVKWLAPRRIIVSMRAIVCVVLTSFLCASQTAARAEDQASGKVAGKVRNSVSGEPIRKATVVLRSSSIPAGSITASRGVFSTFSDPEGGFKFDQVAPGRYMISADRIGFIGGMRTGGSGLGRTRLIQIDAGNSVSDLVLDLVPQAVITGRVIDEDGDPIEKAFVSVGTRRTPENMQSVQTNDLGEFRISGLKAGKYLVLARMMTGFDPMARLDTAARRDSQTFTTTYHPSTTEPAEAAIIPVTAGQEVRGVEIRMRRVRTFRVRGRVTAASGRAFLHTNRPGSLFDRVPPAGVSADGTFEISGLRAGLYEFVVTSAENKTIGIAEVQVSADIDDLTIQPASEGAIRATVKLDPPSEQFKDAKFQIMLVRGDSRGRAGELALPGVETVVDKVVPGRYHVRVMGPQGAVLKSIEVDGKPARAGEVPLNAGSELILVMSTKPGSIEGTIANYKPGESSSRVLLLHANFESSLVGESVVTASVDQTGKFRFQGLAPGVYRLIGANLEFPLLKDPEVLGKLSSKTAKVNVTEGAVANATVDALTIKEAEEIEAGN